MEKMIQIEGHQKRMTVYDAIAVGLQQKIPEIRAIDYDELVQDLKNWADLANNELSSSDVSTAESEILATYLYVEHPDVISVSAMEKIERLTSK